MVGLPSTFISVFTFYGGKKEGATYFALRNYIHVSFTLEVQNKTWGLVCRFGPSLLTF